MEQELVSCKLVSKFHNELRDYFKSIYGLPSIIAFTNTLIYKSIVEKALKDTNNLKYASFITPNGKLKRMNLDFSKFILKDIYAIKLNLTIDKLNNEYAIEHDAINYFGLDINDMLLAGYMRIGYNLYKNQFYIQFDPTYNFPNKKVLNTIEDILIQVNTIYIAMGNNDNYKVFSIKNGDSIKDIIRYFNSYKLEN